MSKKDKLKQIKEIFPYDTPDKSLGFLFWQVSNVWQRNINHELEEFDLTHVQFVLLANIAWMSRTEENITQIRLADYTRTNIMMTSKVVRTLELKGLVIRKEHPTDTRAKVLKATKKGEEIAFNSIYKVIEADERFFNLEKNEIDFLMSILLKLRD